MEIIIPLGFRFIMYVFFGFFMEIIYSVIGINRSLGYTINRRVPVKYLEGFVSLYMIPIHGLGMLIGFEGVAPYIAPLPWIARLFCWMILISGMEAFTGFIYHKLTGFYCWDYYKESRYKVFKNGYTLWTLLPQWGISGLVLEIYSKLLIELSPNVLHFFQAYKF